MIQETQEFSQQIQERVVAFIDTLAASLGVAAEHVYTVLNQQMVLEGYAAFVTIVSLIIMGGIMLRMGVGFHKVNEAKSERTVTTREDATAFFTTFLGVLILVIGFVLLLTVGPTAVLKITNPEYYVIKELLMAL